MRVLPKFSRNKINTINLKGNFDNLILSLDETMIYSSILYDSIYVKSVQGEEIEVLDEHFTIYKDKELGWVIKFADRGLSIDRIELDTPSRDCILFEIEL